MVGNLDDPGDMDLLDRWCGGDNAAGNALFKRHFTSLYRFFASKIDREVDELVQQTLLACVSQRDRFRRQSTFRTYLFAIARYVLYAHLRRQHPTLDIDEISAESLSTSAGSRLARRHDAARLLTALQQLPLEQQLLLELHYWEDLERDQLAEVFEVEPATTRSRLFRAREALRERLAAPDPAPGAHAPPDFEAWARSLRPEPQGHAHEVRNAATPGDTTKA